MALYRALNNLSAVARRGELTRLAHLTAEQVAKLERVGAVARVAAPPLSELPDWAIRAGKLAKIGIEDAEQYLETEPSAIAKALHVKPETEARYREEITSYLVVLPEVKE